MNVNISLEFQEFILIVVAPLVFDGIHILLALSLLVAGAMPLLQVARIFHKHSQRSI